MKAVIPAAGLGTRMLPATKSMPKEMLPVVDKPVIQYVVEEAVEAGADEVLLVTGRGKRAIEDHFDHSFELEHHLRKKGKMELLERVRGISDLVQVHYVRQPEPLGLGHAVLCAKRFVGREPFLVLLGDDIVADEETPAKQLMRCHEETGESVFSVMEVAREEISRYGSIVADETNVEGRYRARDVVEKPAPEEAPSLLASIGRYLFTPEIFTYLEDQEPDEGGEIQLADAMARMARESTLFAEEFHGLRLDVGNVEGFLEANVQMALRRKELREDVRSMLRDVLEG